MAEANRKMPKTIKRQEKDFGIGIKITYKIQLNY